MWGQRRISGTITEAKTGEPLPGATITVKGNERLGNISDIDGNYSIEVSRYDEVILRFSYLGYIAQEIVVYRDIVNVEMISDDKTLDITVVFSKDKIIEPYVIVNTRYTPVGVGCGWDICQVNFGKYYGWNNLTGNFSYNTNFKDNRIMRVKASVGDIIYRNSWINGYSVGFDIRYDRFELEQSTTDMSIFRAGMMIGSYRRFIGVHIEKARIYEMNPNNEYSLILSCESNFNIIKQRPDEEGLPDGLLYNWFGDARPKVSLEAGISKRKQIQFGCNLSVTGSYFKIPFDTDLYAGYWMKKSRYRVALSRSFKKIHVGAGYEQIRHYRNFYLSLSLKMKVGKCSATSGYTL